MTLYLKRFWKENVGVLFFLTLTAICQTLSSIRISSAFNALEDQNVSLFFWRLLQVFGIFLLFLFFTHLEIKIKSQVQQKMATAIRSDITQRLERTSYTDFHEKQVGTYASWLSNDLNTIEQQGIDGFYNVAGNCIMTLASIIGLFYFHWSIVVLTLVLSGVTLLLPKIYQTKMAQVSLETTEEGERFLSRVSDVLSGFDTLFSLNLLHLLTKQTKSASHNLAEAKNRQAIVIANVAVLGAFGNILGQVSVMALTGYLSLHALIPIGSLMSTASLAGVIFNTVGNLSQQLATIKSVKPIFQKFHNVPVLSNLEPSTLVFSNPSISLNQLSYLYGKKNAFRAITQEFEYGKKYALIGPSGSGKSTLLNILNGKLTDYKGSVLFGGKELKEISGKELREQVLYIDQLPYLFDGTIRENITMGESFSEKALQTVLKETALEEVIASLSNGLDTPVGEAGRSLSGGQRQRVALARGLIRGRKIVLVDEGTSSLDEKSALAIEESLVQNPELTVLMITHQLRENIRKKLDGVVQLSS